MNIDCGLSWIAYLCRRRALCCASVLPNESISELHHGRNKILGRYAAAKCGHCPCTRWINSNRDATFCGNVEEQVVLGGEKSSRAPLERVFG
eukprot:scaffold161077_cov39-Prasinocladus_malaysianus.AAC.1